MAKEADNYILRCIDDGKISVDCEKGEIFPHHSGKNFKQMVNLAGYHYLDFKFYGERWSVLVHRIVYLAKYGGIPEGYEVDHIDRNTHNNIISNLRAVTIKENMKNTGRKSSAMSKV